MTRTKLCDRVLPDYTRGEEIFHMTSHIAGGGFGVVALVIGVLWAALLADAWAIVGCAVYGASLVTLYTMSSLYHGLRPGRAKKVMQVFDHCTIFVLIAGTYTPVLFSSIRRASPAWAWVLFGIVWGFAALGIVFNAIDLKRYSRFSMICYIGMGWCILLAAKLALSALPKRALLLLVAGGVVYTVGAVLYIIGKKKRYIHSVFHVFVVIGTLLQAVCVLFYVL